MRVSENFIKHIELFECGGNVNKYLKPYLCPAKIPTIGFGNTYYENGAKVKLSDPEITKERAVEIFKASLFSFEKAVTKLVKSSINQSQFDALVDFAYNAGIGALTISTLLKKVNINPNDLSISLEFSKWVFATINGKKQKLKGLENRRNSEIKMYFTK